MRLYLVRIGDICYEVVADTQEEAVEALRKADIHITSETTMLSCEMLVPYPLSIVNR